MDITRRLSSNDQGYRQGDLSVFPIAKDNKNNLYWVTNNAETILRQTITQSAKYIIVEDANKFPSNGLLSISYKNSQPEIIYYDMKIGNQFHKLYRGFNGIKQSTWPAGSKVILPVMADHTNVINDAIIQIQKKIGLKDSNDNNSLYGLVKSLEKKWLTPKAFFKAYPRIGKPPLQVSFQNLSTGDGIRYLWDFGDGETSSDPNPIHIFKEGIFDIKLTMVCSNWSVSVVNKPKYIKVNNDYIEGYYYINTLEGVAKKTVFTFIDQTQANIVQRHWFLGENDILTDKNEIDYMYLNPGKYKTYMIAKLENGKSIRIDGPGEINVS